MKRLLTIGILVGAASLVQVSTASAQRWGRGATPRTGVCFYEDINFGGRYFCSAAGESTSAVPSGMNDRISSVRVFGNSTVTLYRDPNFRGQSKTVSGEVADLRSLGFNDRLSSYQVDTAQGYYRDRDRDSYGGYGVGRDRGQVTGTAGARWSYRQAESIVRRSYRSVLQREPDESGLRSWTQQVMNNNWTERDLEQALRQSDEYRTLRQNERESRPYRRR